MEVETLVRDAHREGRRQDRLRVLFGVCGLAFVLTGAASMALLALVPMPVGFTMAVAVLPVLGMVPAAGVGLVHLAASAKRRMPLARALRERHPEARRTARWIQAAALGVFAFGVPQVVPDPSLGVLWLVVVLLVVVGVPFLLRAWARSARTPEEVVRRLRALPTGVGLHDLARELLALGRPEEVVDALEARFQAGYGSAAYATTYASALLALGRVEEAETFFGLALKADPTWAPAWTGLAKVALARGDVDEGTTALAEAAIRYARRPRIQLWARDAWAEALVARADLLDALGRPAEAADARREAAI